MSELSLLPTDDLLDELAKRHDAMVFTAIKLTKATGEYVTCRRYDGNRLYCSGLVSIMAQKLSNDELDQTRLMGNDRGDR